MTLTASSEAPAFPLTGDFLAGRLRQNLSLDDLKYIEGLVDTVAEYGDTARLLARGTKTDRSTILIEGYIFRTIESAGKRFITGIHVPGDFVDLHGFALKRLDHNIDCVGRATIGQVPHSAITRVMAERPHLARLFWFSTLLDAAMHREWIMKLEQLTAPKRIAHVFAEIWRRLDMVGLGYPDGFETPLRQTDIAEMCGATAIHTNRALADLRRNGLADFQRGKVRIADRRKLEAYADFDPAYLYSDGALALRKTG